jgi:hypothetical protein
MAELNVETISANDSDPKYNSEKRLEAQLHSNNLPASSPTPNDTEIKQDGLRGWIIVFASFAIQFIGKLQSANMVDSKSYFYCYSS